MSLISERARTGTNGHERARTGTNGHKRSQTGTNGHKRSRTRARTVTNRHESTEFAQHTSKHSMRTAWRHLTETCLHAPEMAALANVAKEVVWPLHTMSRTSTHHSTYLRLKYRSEMFYFAHTYHNAHMENACMLCKCCRFVAIRDRSWPFTNVVMQMPSIRGRLWLGLFATSWRSSSSSYRQDPTLVSRLGVRLQIWCDITRTIDNVVLLLP